MKCSDLIKQEKDSAHAGHRCVKCHFEPSKFTVSVVADAFAGNTIVPAPTLNINPELFETIILAKR